MAMHLFLLEGVMRLHLVLRENIKKTLSILVFSMGVLFSTGARTDVKTSAVNAPSASPFQL